MRKAPDYYAILQVDPRAEREVVEAAYRRLAAKYHPDVDPSPGATERMSLINAAYEVLSDPARRRAYDLHRNGSTPEPVGTPPQASPRQGQPEWLVNLAVMVVMLVLTAALSRFGIRGLLLVGVLALVVWLLMASRKS